MEKSEYEKDIEAFKRIDAIAELLPEEKRGQWDDVKVALLQTDRLTHNAYREFVQHLARNRVNLRIPG